MPLFEQLASSIAPTAANNNPVKANDQVAARATSNKALRPVTRRARA